MASSLPLTVRSQEFLLHLDQVCLQALEAVGVPHLQHWLFQLAQVETALGLLESLALHAEPDGRQGTAILAVGLSIVHNEHGVGVVVFVEGLRHLVLEPFPFVLGEAVGVGKLLGLDTVRLLKYIGSKGKQPLQHTASETQSCVQ